MRTVCSWFLATVATLCILVVAAPPAGPPQSAPPTKTALLKVALLQMQPDGDNPQATMDKAEDFCRRLECPAALVGSLGCLIRPLDGPHHPPIRLNPPLRPWPGPPDRSESPTRARAEC